MKPHPASCCCEPCLQQIEAQFDGSQPYYVRYLVAALRHERAHIDATWQHIERGWDIEDRAYFEREAPRNGFTWPLMQAVHHIWKRQTKEVA